MAEWLKSNCIITKAGNKLLSYVIAGLATLDISRAVVRETVSTAGKNKNYNLSDITNIKQTGVLLKFRGGIENPETGDYDTSLVTARFSNEDLTVGLESYKIRQIVVMARLTNIDTDEMMRYDPSFKDPGEVPYLVAQSNGEDDFDLMPSREENPTSFDYDLYIIHTGVPNISVSIRTLGWVSEEDFNRSITEIWSVVNNNIENEVGQNTDKMSFYNKAWRPKLSSYTYTYEPDEVLPVWDREDSVLPEGKLSGNKTAERFNSYKLIESVNEGDYPDNIATGGYSHVEGANNMTTSHCSHVEGINNYVGYSLDDNLGDGNFNANRGTHVEGDSNTAVHSWTQHVEGVQNYSSAYASHTEGKFNINKGYISHIQGRKNQILNGESSTANFVGGENNVIKSGSCSIAFGKSNVNEDSTNSIITGHDNSFTSSNNSILCGTENVALNSSNSVVTGASNVLNQSVSSVLSGEKNNVSGSDRVMSGGYNNTVVNSWDSIVGGRDNHVANSRSVLVSGVNHRINSSQYVAVFGNGNITNEYDDYSLVCGQSNQVYYSTCSLVTGKDNQIDETLDSIVGGLSNLSNKKGKRLFIMGMGNSVSSEVYGNNQDSNITGRENKITDIEFSSVFGKGNTVQEVSASLVCGAENIVESQMYEGSKDKSKGIINSIVTGFGNRLKQTKTSVVAGMNNDIQDYQPHGIPNEWMLTMNNLFSGEKNTIKGMYSSIITGYGNIISNIHDSIIGGKNNNIDGLDAPATSVTNSVLTMSINAKVTNHMKPQVIFGSDNEVSGDNTLTSGTNLISSGNSSVTLGKWNEEDDSNYYALVIGGGTGETSRKNILTLDWSGRLNVADLYFESNKNSVDTRIKQLESQVSQLITKVAELEEIINQGG